jgi:hypothetical protein
MWRNLMEAHVYVAPNYQHQYSTGVLTPGSAPDYHLWLYQTEKWPSADKDELLDIALMHPAHAINAFHRLTAGCDDRSDPANDMVYSCPLALALLEQAVGEKVVYADPITTGVDVSLEDCFDFISEIDATSGHPIARARRLQALMRDGVA